MHSFPEHATCGTGVGIPKEGKGRKKGNQGRGKRKEGWEKRKEGGEGKESREGKWTTGGVGEETYHACNLVRTVLVTLTIIPGCRRGVVG